MRVRCLQRTGERLPSAVFGSRSGYSRETEFYLTVGREYVVYGLTLWQGVPWIYICDDLYADGDIWWPVWHPLMLFEIVDARISMSWVIARSSVDEPDALFITFPQWADDRGFYERLIDSRGAEFELFEAYKREADAEDRGSSPDRFRG